MKNIRTIVQALSTADTRGIEKSFYRQNDKIALLFKMLVDDLDDSKIKNTLNLSTNAYSTLRSRLNVKIQDYLIAKSDSPKANVLNKLLSIDDIVFTQQPTIALTTLKKLERELIRHDLSNELTTVYKYLKKLHLNSDQYFHYSQLYNRHVAYSLALDKAEDILAKYFKEYGLFYAFGATSKRLELTALFEEMKNVCALYQSHRMFVYLAALEIFHRLFVDEDALDTYNLDPIEDILYQVELTFVNNPNDSIYKHLKLLFHYIQFEYYLKYGIVSKARLLMDEINNDLPNLLTYYENYSFPAQVLIGKLQLKNSIKSDDFRDAKLFEKFAIENCSLAAKVVYSVYRALACYYSKDYSSASSWLFQLNNEVSFKEHLVLNLELKCLTAYIKVAQNDRALFKQNFTSAQRTLRILGTERAQHLAAFVKLLSLINSDSNKNKEEKIIQQVENLQQYKPIGFTPTLYLKLDAAFILRTIR